METTNLLLVTVALLLSFSTRPSNSDFKADYNECVDQLIGLSTCLPFVGGDAKAPTPDCCDGYKQVTAKSVKCVCILIKDRNDPGLGLKIDVDYAIQLPSKCHSPFNISTCTSILKLPTNSKAAQDFQQLENILEGKGSATATRNNNTGEMGPHSKSGNSTASPKSSGKRNCNVDINVFCAMTASSLLFALLLI